MYVYHRTCAQDTRFRYVVCVCVCVVRQTNNCFNKVFNEACMLASLRTCKHRTCSISYSCTHISTKRPFLKLVLCVQQKASKQVECWDQMDPPRRLHSSLNIYIPNMETSQFIKHIYAKHGDFRVNTYVNNSYIIFTKETNLTKRERVCFIVIFIICFQVNIFNSKMPSILFAIYLFPQFLSHLHTWICMCV